MTESARDQADTRAGVASRQTLGAREMADDAVDKVTARDSDACAGVDAELELRYMQHNLRFWVLTVWLSLTHWRFVILAYLITANAAMKRSDGTSRISRLLLWVVQRALHARGGRQEGWVEAVAAGTRWSAP